MRFRILVIIGAMALALGLVGVALTMAQGAVSSRPGTDESGREAAAAAALEANPGPVLRSAAVFTPPAVISAPLFVGTSNDALFTFVVDPDTAANYPLFDGFEVWGAAFDTDNRRMFFNQGPTLYEWPLDGAPGALGQIKGGVSGANLSMYGLAYAGGTLYAARPLNTAADPEGIYTIEPATLSATLWTTYTAALEDTDIGGLAADPATGALYGTNDADALRGLVQIDPNGSLSILAPYPAGEEDIDGLAYADGRAYLVTDEPGPIYVFDFATMTYTAPITNPWTTEELFAGAAWITAEEVVTPTISLEKTVGTNPNVCATTHEIAVSFGTTVTYCYEITNTGEVTLTKHMLVDSELGNLLTDFPYSLAPAASAFLTATTEITQSTINTATWTAYNPGPTDVVSATAEATVTVLEPSISLSKTVGINPNGCALTSAITVNAGTSVTYCYEVTNTGDITLTRHALNDTELGNLLTDFPNSLAPAASLFVTETAQITQTTVNTATWTAYNPGPTDVVSATAAATVTVEPIGQAPDIGVQPAALAAELSPNGLLTRTLAINNSGNANLEWAISLAPESCAAPGVVSWASFGPGNGTTEPGGANEVIVTFVATGAPVGNEVTGLLCITSNDPDEPVVAVPLSLMVDAIKLRLPIIVGSPSGGTRAP